MPNCDPAKLVAWRQHGDNARPRARADRGTVASLQLRAALERTGWLLYGPSGEVMSRDLALDVLASQVEDPSAAWAALADARPRRCGELLLHLLAGDSSFREAPALSREAYACAHRRIYRELHRATSAVDRRFWARSATRAVCAQLYNARLGDYSAAAYVGRECDQAVYDAIREELRASGVSHLSGGSLQFFGRALMSYALVAPGMSGCPVIREAGSVNPVRAQLVGALSNREGFGLQYACGLMPSDWSRNIVQPIPGISERDALRVFSRSGAFLVPLYAFLGGHWAQTGTAHTSRGSARREEQPVYELPGASTDDWPRGENPASALERPEEPPHDAFRGGFGTADAAPGAPTGLRRPRQHADGPSGARPARGPLDPIAAAVTNSIAVAMDASPETMRILREFRNLSVAPPTRGQRQEVETPFAGPSDSSPGPEEMAQPGESAPPADHTGADQDSSDSDMDVSPRLGQSPDAAGGSGGPSGDLPAPPAASGDTRTLVVARPLGPGALARVADDYQVRSSSGGTEAAGHLLTNADFFTSSDDSDFEPDEHEEEDSSDAAEEPEYRPEHYVAPPGGS